MSSWHAGTSADAPALANVGRRWYFTWRHYTEACEDQLAALADPGILNGFPIRARYVAYQEVVPTGEAPYLMGCFFLEEMLSDTALVEFLRRGNLTYPDLMIAREDTKKYVRSWTTTGGAVRGSIVIHGWDLATLPKCIAKLREADDMTQDAPDARRVLAVQ